MIHRYLDEVIAVLAGQASDLHQALDRAQDGPAHRAPRVRAGGNRLQAPAVQGLEAYAETLDRERRPGMRGTIGSRRPRRLAGPVPAAIGTMAVLAGCGSSVAAGAGQPAGNAGASSGVPLCASAGRLDQVMLRLTASPAGEILPRAATITDAPRVRALAAALCRLPPAPGGLHCPAARPGALLLEFSAQGHGYAPVRIRDSGCATVSGLGTARQWTWSSRPGRLLSGAVSGKGRLVPGTHPSSVPTE